MSLPRRGGSQRIPRPEVWRPGAAAPWDGATGAGSVADVVRAVTGARLAVSTPRHGAARRSAVLVVLHDGDAGPEVLLTRRAMTLRHHRGEISFPGGRVEPDESDVDTACREAWEEVRLDPASVTVHGALSPVSTFVSESHIVPLVASIDERPRLVAAPEEVDRIMWVPLAELAHPATYREERWGAPPGDRPVHFFELSDETVWGATARMLTQMLCLAHGVPERH